MYFVGYVGVKQLIAENEVIRLSGPVAVGGCGGSGTRVVAEILRALGIRMGGLLNQSLDNLWFSLLFKRPQWLIAVDNNHPQEIELGISIFVKAMEGQLALQPNEYTFIIRALQESAKVRNDYVWPLQVAQNLISSGNVAPDSTVGWGWKEPNSHIFIKHLARCVSDIKYIHIIRHGVDMAFSKNQNQLRNWGSYFSIEMPVSSQAIPRASLSYWVQANRHAIIAARKALGNNFLLIRYEDLCVKPRETVSDLSEFLGANIDLQTLDLAAHIPRIPNSIGRYKNQDLSVFKQSDLAFLEEFGYALDEA
jgi:hypothetical protein